MLSHCLGPSTTVNLPLPRSPLLHCSIEPKVTLSTRISLNFSGETFLYDLQHLDADPREIIELLKSSASERGSYTTVAAHYRRVGNPAAAISVVSAMLEVLALRVSEQDLKPAFLLLAGCETDLGKNNKADTKASSHHYSNSQKWLQKVYGSSSVPSAASEPSSLTRPSTVERQLQSLRDRLNNHVNLLADAHKMKRKLEDDFNLERDKRRKLEREVEELRKERDRARDMEAYALEQMRREIDSRRRAEDRVRDLRIDLDRYARSTSNCTSARRSTSSSHQG
ncbi:hypothetical protein D9758_001967 [Tetrapyrgos nigripes]|uniref:Uncharacterized protein n=1 Tax=Tetrapyrgos nigripes TaxID=182062 RepID=A0A8H5LV82_9AGAR|nr:hypothetical protein D9758_001967 [Tetrapyrgos nigripes]